MVQVQTILEEKGTVVKTPTFLAQVERLATAIDDFLIPSLRLEIHPDSWSPADFLQEIPDLQGTNLPREAVAKIVEQYLGETGTAGKVTGVKTDRFSYTPNPLDQNVSIFPHTVDCWRERHYSRKNRIDRLVDDLEMRIGETAKQGADQIAQQLGLTKYLPQPSLNGTLAYSMAEYTQELYRRTGVQGEEPVRLYQLCFQTLAQTKGWDKMEDKDLVKVLDAEGIPVKEFAELTGREIKTSAEPVIKVGDSRTQTTSSSAATGRCELISTNSWFSALQELRKQGSGKTIVINGQTYVRPFTMKENLQARIEDYNTLTNADGGQRTEEERKRFFNTWLDSCSGIHYLARTKRFKIVPISPELITLAQAPTADYLAVPYVRDSGELGSARGKYNQDLSRAKVLEHPAWLAAAEEDRTLLGEAFDIMRAVKNASSEWKGMGFYVFPDKTQDELRPLFVCGRGGEGNANDGSLLFNVGRLLRVVPVVGAQIF